MNNNNIIETFNLSKIYKLRNNHKGIEALKNINIHAKEGEIFGLLGPNGAGKTTLIQILTTLKQPTSGYALIDGYNILTNPKKAKSRVALMLENKMLYFRITAYDNLKFFCKIYKISNYKEKIDNIVKEFRLEKWLNQYVENLSRGMKMKLALCRTLLLDRKILFLDEPTLGLDVKSVSFIINKLKHMKNTIFLTSHDMNVVEKLCDRIAFINKGKIIKIGSKEDIVKLTNFENNIEINITKNKNQLISELRQYEFVRELHDIKNGLIVYIKNRIYYQNLLMILSKYEILRINDQSPSLEELFLKIV